METRVSLIIFTLFVICVVCAVPKPEEKHTKDQEFERHMGDGGEHDKQYDHEAFLGQEEAKTFDQLAPEESKRRLGLIVDKIDKNGDNFVDIAELKAWISFSQRRYIEDDVERQWRNHNPDNNETIHWDLYRQNVYGFIDEMDPADLEKDNTGFSYKAMLTRDRRRWSVADRNGDDSLTRSEFTDFLHPEENSYMRDIVVAETMEDIDKDNDGKISVEEYIGDMYRPVDDDHEEPEWVTHERETFANFRDKNNDGWLNSDEVREWIVPQDFDHAEAESRHLIYEADSDADEKLTKEEILDKYDIFVGSQATDFGEALVRHDEF